MRLKYRDFWKRYGEFVVVAEDLKEMDSEGVCVPKGTYQIIEKDEFGYELYNITTSEFVHTDGAAIDGDTEFMIRYTDTDTMLDTLYGALTRKAMVLMAEGWTLQDEYEPHSLDIGPLLAQIKIVKLLTEATDGQ